MKTKAINVCVPAELKEDVETILSRLGMTTTQAITMYFEQIRMKRSLPFSVNLVDDDSLQPAPIVSEWPEGYFEHLAAWEDEDIVRPEQGEYETRLELE